MRMISVLLTTYQQGEDMKKLEILCGTKQHLNTSDLMDCLGVNKSALARAAYELGLMQIKELAARDKEKAQELVAMNDFKARG